jgi:hypothetical protein
MSEVDARSPNSQRGQLLMTLPKEDFSNQKNLPFKCDRIALSSNREKTNIEQPKKIFISGLSKYSSNRPQQLSIDLNTNMAEQFDSPGFKKDWKSIKNSQEKSGSAGLKLNFNKKSLFKIGKGSFKQFHTRKNSSNINVEISPVVKSKIRLARLGSYSDTDEPNQKGNNDPSFFSPEGNNQQKIATTRANIEYS